MKLATASEMQQLDRSTIEEVAIPGIVLMENAGRGTVEFLKEELGSVQGRSVIIFIGPGNNGGDGLVIGRTLAQSGCRVLLVYLVDPMKLRGDAAINRQVVQHLGLQRCIITESRDLDQLTVTINRLHSRYPVCCLVDALFGTGLARELTGRFGDTVRLINHLRRKRGWPVLAVDLPSGLEADTGRALGVAVQADLTATYGLAKPAHLHHGGPNIGKLRIIDISIPGQVVAAANLEGEAIGSQILALRPIRERQAHKGTFGHCCILSGSLGKTGAAILCGLGALHSGTGLVTLGVPHLLNPIFATRLPEAMTVPLGHSDTLFSIGDYPAILDLLSGKKSLVLGPGLGTAELTRKLVVRLYQEVKLPMVVDADGLNILASELEEQQMVDVAGPRILTPHPGEMARLCRRAVRLIQDDRLHTSLWLSRLSAQDTPEMITVLKGAGTVVADNRGRWAINTSGNPGMGCGGMGDVLAGILGGLLAQGLSCWDAARLGVYVHGRAADLLAAQRPAGYLASEVAAALPLVWDRQEQPLS